LGELQGQFAEFWTLRQVVRLNAIEVILLQDSQHRQVPQLRTYHSWVAPNAMSHILGRPTQVRVMGKEADEVPFQQVVGISLDKYQQGYINLFARSCLGQRHRFLSLGRNLKIVPQTLLQLI
jgi:hypothetical protein